MGEIHPNLQNAVWALQQFKAPEQARDRLPEASQSVETAAGSAQSPQDQSQVRQNLTAQMPFSNEALPDLKSLNTQLENRWSALSSEKTDQLAAQAESIQTQFVSLLKTVRSDTGPTDPLNAATSNPLQAKNMGSHRTSAPQAAALLAEAQAAVNQPSALKSIFQQASQNPSDFKALFETLSDGTPAQQRVLTDVALNWLNSAQPSLRDVAIEYLQYQIEQSSNSENARYAARAVFDHIQPRDPLQDSQGMDLVTAAYEHFYEGVQLLGGKGLAEADVTAIVRLLEVQTQAIPSDIEVMDIGDILPATYQSGISLAALLVHSASKSQPGAKQVLVDEMLADKSPAAQALFKVAFMQNADKKLTRELMPLIAAQTPFHRGYQTLAPRQWVIDKLASGVSQQAAQQTADKLAERYGAKLKEAVTTGQPVVLKQMAELMQALHLIQNPQGQDLSAFDAQKVQAQITRLLNSSAMQSVMRDLRTQATAEGGNAITKETPETLAKYILGSDFQRSLALLHPSERGERIQFELQKLALLDPDKAASVARDLTLSELSKQSFADFRQMSELDITNSLQKTFLLVEEVGSDGIQIAEGLARGIKSGELKKAEDIEKWLDKQGLASVSGKILAAFGAASAVIKGVNLDDAASIIDFAGESVQTSSRLTSFVAKNKASMKFLGKLGPVADIFSGAAQGIRLAEAIDKGDVITAISAGFKTTGNLTSAIGGGLLIAGKSGAWPLLIVGGGLSVIGELFSNTPQKDFLIDVFDKLKKGQYMT